MIETSYLGLSTPEPFILYYIVKLYVSMLIVYCKENLSDEG